MKIFFFSFKNGTGKDSVIDEEVLIHLKLFSFPLQQVEHILTVTLWLAQHSNQSLISFIHFVFVNSFNKYFKSTCCNNC